MRPTLFLSIYLFFSLLCVSAQNVTTYGGGTPDDGIAVDDQGNIYASNFVGDTVFKFTAEGEVSSFITGLDTPNGLAFDPDGNLFVCDWNANTVYKYDASGALLESYGASGNPSGLIQSFDGTHMVFTEYSGNKINRLEADGSVNTLSSASELNGPVGLAYDPSGTLYVGNYNNREIYRVQTNGDLEYVAQLPATGALPNLGFITFGQGYLWGTILGTNKIYKINPNATDDYQVFAGSTQGNVDGDISIATFNRPNGILFNASEDIMYITDFGSKNLRVISGVQLSNEDFAVKKSNILIYPNPALNHIFISVDEPSHLWSFRIYDALGKEVYVSTTDAAIGSTAKRVDLGHWPSGTYLVKVETANDIFVQKFIK